MKNQRKYLLKKTIKLLLLVTWVCSGLFACVVEKPHVLFLHGNARLDLQLNLCVLSAPSLDLKTMNWGVLDLNLSQEYMMNTIVENKAIENNTIPGVNPLQVNNNTVQITVVRFDYRVPDGDNGKPLVDVPQTTVIRHLPDSLNPLSLRILAFPSIDPNVADVLVNGPNSKDYWASQPVENQVPPVELLVDIQLEGILMDGSLVRSNLFTYPIYICKGCLLDDSPADCTAAPTAEIPCLFGQDDTVDCRLCYNLKGDLDLCDPNQLTF